MLQKAPSPPQSMADDTAGHPAYGQMNDGKAKQQYGNIFPASFLTDIPFCTTVVLSEITFYISSEWLSGGHSLRA